MSYKQILILIVLVSLIGIMLAKYSDEFLIGNYSYWRTYGKWNDLADTVFAAMEDSGYNNTICEIYSLDDNLSTMLDKLNSHHLDATLIDNEWDGLQTTGEYATKGLTMSNYLILEAEYYSPRALNKDDDTDDRFFYASPVEYASQTPRVGNVFRDSTKSNGFAWRCIPGVDTPGYAYKNVTYRWQQPGQDSLKWEKLKEALHFNRSWDTKTNEYTINNSYLEFTFAINISNAGNQTGKLNDLLRFEIGGEDWNGKEVLAPHSNSNALYYNYAGTQTRTIITSNDIEALPESNDNLHNKLITIRVSLKDLSQCGLLSSAIPDTPYFYSSKLIISNINPRVYWYGNADFTLDYIRIEDNIHKDMSQPGTTYFALMNRRLSLIKSYAANDNLKYMYSYDEPLQAQFDSYRLVQNSIEQSNPAIFTAVYDIQRDMVKDNLSKDVLDKYYQHQIAFIKEAKPKILCPDLYPLRPGIVWNRIKDPGFFQTTLENLLLVKYDYYKKQSILNPEMKFIPVVQAFGEWSRKGIIHQWSSWFRPPAETQTMLQLLPLCYGADGIIDYLFSTWNLETYPKGDKSGYQYGSLSMLPDGKQFKVTPTSIYNPIKAANAKIKVYGPLLKSSASKWLGTECLKVGQDPQGLNLNSLFLSSLQIINPQNGKYQGYVQCGAFADSTGNPEFMLVNRRTNYLKACANPLYTDNAKLDNCFAAFKAQKVSFVPNPEAESVTGTFSGLYDPYDKVIYIQKDKSIDVPIAAGEGKLLQMVGTLPNEVKSNALISGKGYLKSDITISHNAQVSFAPNSTVTILPNAKIIIKRGSVLALEGKLITGTNTSIVNQGGVLWVNGSPYSAFKFNKIINLKQYGLGEGEILYISK